MQAGRGEYGDGGADQVETEDPEAQTIDNHRRELPVVRLLLALQVVLDLPSDVAMSLSVCLSVRERISETPPVQTPPPTMDGRWSSLLVALQVVLDLLGDVAQLAKYRQQLTAHARNRRVSVSGSGRRRTPVDRSLEVAAVVDRDGVVDAIIQSY